MWRPRRRLLFLFGGVGVKLLHMMYDYCQYNGKQPDTSMVNVVITINNMVMWRIREYGNQYHAWLAWAAKVMFDYIQPSKIEA